MQEKEKTSPRKIDPSLDVPAEANTDKHINFLKLEENDTDSGDKLDKETEERQKQWKQGLEEGRRESGASQSNTYSSE